MGLYEYDPNSGLWDRLPATWQRVQDSNGSTAGALFTDNQYQSIPNFDGYLGLFTSTAAPAAPILNPVQNRLSGESCPQRNRGSPPWAR